MEAIVYALRRLALATMAEGKPKETFLELAAMAWDVSWERVFSGQAAAKAESKPPF